MILAGGIEYSSCAMYTVYSLLLLLSMLFTIPAYLIRYRLKRGEPLRLLCRLGLRLPQSPGDDRPSLWIHAVSVGEVLSLQRLVEVIKERRPGWRIYLSTLTATGMQMAREKLPAVDRLFYVPLDFRWSVCRFFRILKPDLFVLAESEFWPNLLRCAGRHCSGVFLINGRISPKSARRYRRVKPLIKKVLKPVDLFLVQTQRDGDRLAGMGIEGSRILASGNLKADVRPPRVSEEKVRGLGEELNLKGGERLLVAGSTHRGEEVLLLDAFAEALGRDSRLRLILAPRHVDRAGEVEKICRDLGLSFRRRTEPPGGGAWDVLILDTIGELAGIYAIADLAFLGGSLVPWGGQNFLEPASYGKPVFFGPHMQNFRDLADLFLEEKAAKTVTGKADLVAMFLAEDRSELAEMGEGGRRLLSSLRGATEKAVKIFEESMERG